MNITALNDILDLLINTYSQLVTQNIFNTYNAFGIIQHILIYKLELDTIIYIMLNIELIYIMYYFEMFVLNIEIP